MSTIRRQSIISSVIVYVGFAVGALNIYLFARGFEPSQFGLTTLFVNMANIMFAFANLGMQVYIYKLYPYYKDNLRPEENDMMSWALLVSGIGFAGVVVAGILWKRWILSNFEQNSQDLTKYYYWVFPFGLGLTLYSLLEAYSLHLNRTILTSFLRELLFRIFTTILILLAITGLLTHFSTFIKLYAFSYLLLASVLFVYLVRKKELYFPLSPSRVTRKFFKKIRTMAILSWGAGLVFNLSTFFAVLIIAVVVPKGLESAAVYSIAAYAGSVMQAPQRTLMSAAIGPLSRAWKDKDYPRINRIYHRSSINQLIFAVGMFVLIWINYTDGVLTLHMNKAYLGGLYAFLFIGLTRIVDMGTGVNAQIIGTSTYWRFELFSGVILLVMTLPLNYYLASRYGLIGPAIADLITFSFYNGIRCIFLYRKFNMQPFSVKTIYTLLLGLAGYLVCHFAFDAYQGFAWLVIRSLVFLVIYIAGVVVLNLSEDVLPVWRTAKKKLSYLCGRFFGP